MILKNLEITNFRNYSSLMLSPKNGLNVFYGFNAQGKTNLLEAIYYLATASSHRSLKDVELINWGKSSFIVKGSISTAHSNLVLEAAFKESGQKILRVGGLKQTKLPDYLGNMLVVLFSPEDLVIVKGSPRERRRFLDIEISQLSRNYAYLLIQYNKTLSQRNNLLKTLYDRKQVLEQLEVWDNQLVTIGSKILYKRLETIKKIANYAKINHTKLSAGTETLDVKYVASFPLKPDFSLEEIINNYQVKLTETRSEELNRGITLVGPHRDDLVFYINRNDAKLYGSQGQQRTIALSLKLAELDLIYSETGDYPILLLDDVLSELDNLRRHFLLTSVMDKVQTFITTTNLEFADEEVLREANTYRIDEGRIIPS